MRCAWVPENKDFYIKYHDEEWGVPVYDDRLLFEMLILEGAQAGLSWETILKRRDSYKKAFTNFEPNLVAKFDAKKEQELLLDAGIIRNRLKIKSAIRNAKIFLEIQKEFSSFVKYIWSFTDGRIIINSPKAPEEIPVSTDLSDQISKDLKKRGMNFVGATIIYAYLQAIGVVDDHQKNCFKAIK